MDGQRPGPERCHHRAGEHRPDGSADAMQQQQHARTADDVLGAEVIHEMGHRHRIDGKGHAAVQRDRGHRPHPEPVAGQQRQCRDSGEEGGSSIVVVPEGYDLVFEMDADLSHDPSHLPAFLEAFEQGADLVIGSRNIPGGGVTGWGPGRHFLSKGGSFYSRTILGLRIRDLTSGYKAFRAETLRAIDLDAVQSEGYSFQIELTYRALRRGCRVVEVPIHFVDRKAGQSKMSRRIFAEAIGMVWKLRWDAQRGRF